MAKVRKLKKKVGKKVKKRKVAGKSSAEQPVPVSARFQELMEEKKAALKRKRAKRRGEAENEQTDPTTQEWAVQQQKEVDERQKLKRAKRALRVPKKKKKKPAKPTTTTTNQSTALHIAQDTPQTQQDDGFEEVSQQETTLEEPKGRNYTVSLALPGSIMANAQSPELRTYLAGQIARALSVFSVDEVVVFSERGEAVHEEGEWTGAGRRSDPNVFLARVLQYLETPQYLRKLLFPVHKDLKYAGLLNPLDAPHHVRANQDVQFREGVVVSRPVKGGQGAWVNIGLQKDCRIPQPLQPGIRVTVELDEPESSTRRKKVHGKAVAPSKPRTTNGTYWGYTTRLAAGLQQVWAECPFEGGYDLKVGTSDRGQPVHSPDFALPPFRHLLIVFGGLGGLEDCVLGDDNVQASDPNELFDVYINACENQGSRTIRTEEAIPIALSALHGHFRLNRFLQPQ